MNIKLNALFISYISKYFSMITLKLMSYLCNAVSDIVLSTNIFIKLSVINFI